MSPEESQEELFNRLLNYIEKSPQTFLLSFVSAIKVPDSESCNSPNLAGITVRRNLEKAPHSQEKNDSLNMEDRQENIREAFIKVMSSKIFYKGGLKGRPLTRNNLDYKIYFFKDLAFFILMATNYLTNENFDNKLKDIILDKFDSVLNKIDELKSIAIIFCFKANYNKLDKIKIKLEHVKSIMLAKPVSDLRTSLKNTADRVDVLIKLFQEQLPLNTPDSLISEAISILLEVISKLP
jgi:hypothetical protein